MGFFDSVVSFVTDLADKTVVNQGRTAKQVVREHPEKFSSEGRAKADEMIERGRAKEAELRAKKYNK